MPKYQVLKSVKAGREYLGPDAEPITLKAEEAEPLVALGIIAPVAPAKPAKPAKGEADGDDAGEGKGEG